MGKNLRDSLGIGFNDGETPLAAMFTKDDKYFAVLMSFGSVYLFGVTTER